jgi:dihydrofolate reductase
MAHVIHSINITAGGSCHHADAIADEEHHRYASDQLASASAVLLGRNTFDLLESFWPEAVNRPDLPSYMTDFAAELEAKPKYVLSNRSLTTEWKNTELVRGSELGAVGHLINGIPGTLIIFGSPSLGTALASAGLVHEIHLVVQPFIGATERRAFADFDTRKSLALLEARPFRSGVVLLRYAYKA